MSPGLQGSMGGSQGMQQAPQCSPREGRAAAAAPDAASARLLQDLSASGRHQPGAEEIHGQTSREKPSPKGSHERRPAAGGMQLTPEQQKVAAALLVVINRAYMNEEDPSNLICNNSAKRCLVERLSRLSKGNALLSLASFGRDAPSELLDSLTLLAKQCAAAGCQPLEVLTWSVQCDTHKKCMSDEGSVHERLQLLDTVADSIAGASTGNNTALVKLGVSQDVAALVACFLNTFMVLHNEKIARTWREQRSDLDHMLPGETQCASLVHAVLLRKTAPMQQNARQQGHASGTATNPSSCFVLTAGAMDVLASNVHADWTHGKVLRKLVRPIKSALQAYKDRAVATGQSYKHVVMLQAAVQGWCAIRLSWHGQQSNHGLAHSLQVRKDASRRYIWS